jgi:hypothetical protein
MISHLVGLGNLKNWKGSIAAVKKPLPMRSLFRPNALNAGLGMSIMQTGPKGQKLLAEVFSIAVCVFAFG